MVLRIKSIKYWQKLSQQVFCTSFNFYIQSLDASVVQACYKEREKNYFFSCFSSKRFNLGIIYKQPPFLSICTL
jgi:hypothetical protein